MLEYKEKFDTILGLKNEPNAHERYLFERAKKYIQKLTWIPGIEMIAVVNSLSMYATHKDSDIDLFIITKPGMIWFVRFFVTLTLWVHGVWRKGEDIRENFCLSFFITTEAMDLEKIALENDIYLSYWTYYLKPIYFIDDTYEEFLRANEWVQIPDEQKEKNLSFIIAHGNKEIPFYGEHIQDTNKLSSKGMPTAGQKLLNQIIRFFLLPKSLKKYKQLGYPEGVIITDNMLKFHDQDARAQIRDTILEKNFDK